VQQRRLGRTGHLSSVAILGGAAFGGSTVEVVEQAFALADSAGVNHLDIAPSYGHAEQVVGEVLGRYRDRWFVACKTMVRDGAGARRELEESLARLRTDHFDLYQLHAVTSEAELEAALAPGGAAETLLAARDEGVVGAIGITGHFQRVPGLFLQALERLDLDTVMLPANPPMLAMPDYRAPFEQLLALAALRDIGVMAIKAVARSRWPAAPEGPTWYRPHRDPDRIETAVRFALSLPITAIAAPGDVSLLADVLGAAERFERLGEEEMSALVRQAAATDALVG
jgi:aryl-alcohol dehydrogenase-like predicted oxidoreductase